MRFPDHAFALESALRAFLGVLIVVGLGCGRIGFQELCLEGDTGCTFGVQSDGGPAANCQNQDDGTECTDNDPCTQLDLCQLGSCVPGTPICSEMPAISIEVGPLYPSFGAQWNDYVLRDGDLATDASDLVACDGSEATRISCLHGGEMRAAELPGSTSCDDVVASDARDAFNWHCVRKDGKTIVYSSALTIGRGLGYLVDANGFRPNTLEVQQGAVTYRSDLGSWWSNPVVPLPAPTGTITILDSPGAVYLVDNSETRDGVRIDADRISLVVADNAVLTDSGSGSLNCNQTTAEVAAADAHCLVATADQYGVWIEGSFHGNASEMPSQILMAGALRLSRFHQLRLKYARGPCMTLQSSLRNLVQDVQASDCHGGLSLSGGSAGNLVQDFVSANSDAVCCASGVRVFGDGNVFHRLTLSGAYDGIYIDGRRNNTVTQMTSAANAWGMQLFALAAQTFVATTIIDTTSAVTDFGAASRGQTFVSTVSYRNRLSLGYQQSGLQVVNFAGAEHGPGIALSGSSDSNSFAGKLMLSDSQAGPLCSIQSTGLAPGLVPDSCTSTGIDGSSDYPGQLSTAVLQTGIDLNMSFAAAIAQDDSVNDSDLLGQRDASEITDWTSFETPFRFWGRDGEGQCSGGLCKIWDARLIDPSSAVFNTSGPGVGKNEAFVAGSPCPSAVNGNLVVDDKQDWTHATGLLGVENLADGIGNDDGTCEPGERCHNRFLANAIERVGDLIGDEDGLCESGESCIYAPHFGAYQGEGSLDAEATCSFSDGLVVEVSMIAYPKLSP